MNLADDNSPGTQEVTTIVVLMIKRAFSFEKYKKDPEVLKDRIEELNGRCHLILFGHPYSPKISLIYFRVAQKKGGKGMLQFLVQNELRLPSNGLFR